MSGNFDGILGGLFGVFSLLLTIPWIIIALIGWFILKFVYKSVTGGKEIQPKQAAVIWLVIFLILFSFPLFRNKSNQPQVSKEYSSSIPIFYAVNDARANKGLTILQVDERLCAYAKRRALQYQEKVVVPGGEDFNLLPLEIDPQIDNTYFKDFAGGSTETVMRVGFQTSRNIADKFTDEQNKGAARLDLTHGCVAEAATSNGTGTWTVFIGAVAK